MSACAENRPSQSASVLDCGDKSPHSTTRHVALFQLVAPESDAGGSADVSKMSTRTAKVALLLAIVSVCLFGYVLNSQNGILREFQAALIQEQWMLLVCLAVWCGTFIFLTFSLKDLTLIGLLLIAIAAFFISQAASRPAVDAIILLAGVTLGRGVRVLLNEEFRMKNEVCGNTLEIVNRKSAIVNLLVGLVLLLAFASWWHLDVAHSFYPGTRWTGLWENPNTYGMLMGAGVVLTAGLFAASLKSKVQSPKSKIQGQTSTVPSPQSKIGKDESIWKSAIRNPQSAILLVAAGMMGVGLFFSYSRGAWLGTAISLLYLVKAYGKFKWRFVLPGIVAVAAVVFCFWHSTSDTGPWYLKRMDLSRASAQHRVAAWRGAVQMMRDHPFGVGWNKAVETYEKNYSPPEGGVAAITTNDYLMLGTQLGFPGLLCFLAYVVLSLKGESRKQKAEIPPLVTRHSSPAIASPATCHLSLQAASRAGVRSCDALVAESAGDAPSPGPAANQTTSRISSCDKGVAVTFCDGASQLRVACRAGALAMLVAFWFDGGLFTLATASVFWILLELSQVRNAECGVRNPPSQSYGATSAEAG